ncbi:MAG: peptide chain release factor N(5)-glutamine methyltransferase [Chloroflexi bacterium]|nr:peptide chain release factor N(5)-glutamine methyltransferase [Chloroflexota bacterium]
MTLGQSLARAWQCLAAGGVEDAAFEGELLLRHALGIERSQLYLEMGRDLTPAEFENYQGLVERRLAGEPSAYITGRREFYGLDFQVDRRVLIPRPETELLVEQAIELARRRGYSTIADIGAGSGAVAVSLAINLPGAVIYAIDISSPALEAARLNCLRHGVEGRVRLLEGDLLAPLPEAVDLIVANLPYVRRSDLPATGPLSFEPVLALDGGPDGLDQVRRLTHQAADRLTPGGSLLLEIGQGQGEAVAALLRQVFPRGEVRIWPDLAGIDRVAGLMLPLPALNQRCG